MRYLVLFLVLCLAGCSYAEKVFKERDTETEAVMKTLDGKKIQSSRFNGTSLDLVLEDGKLVTFYGFTVTNAGDVFEAHIGVK